MNPDDARKKALKAKALADDARAAGRISEAEAAEAAVARLCLNHGISLSAPKPRPRPKPVGVVVSPERAQAFVMNWIRNSVGKRGDPWKKGRKAARSQHQRTNAWKLGCSCADCEKRREVEADLGNKPEWMK